MASILHHKITEAGVGLHLSDGVASVVDATAEDGEAHMTVVTQSGKRLPADLVILAIGVKPETSLARDAGLTLGIGGGIVVTDELRCVLLDARHCNACAAMHV